MSLSVIIPSKLTLNLRACLAALQLDPGARPIVVDDGVHPAILGGCTVVKGIKPFVFARNCNLGICAAGSDDVVLLNDDALLKTPGGLSALQQVHRENPEYGIIAAVTDVVGNVNQRPSAIGLREETHMVCFVCVYIPRSTIDLVGMLDEEFVGYGYDDDSYCVRVKRKGLKIGIFDGCFVDHSSLQSTYRGRPHASIDMRQNRRIFLQKYGAESRCL